ncbi:hypothetical protein C4901_11495 [Acidiferrobacter sp. SPIII_3]|nr:hypothetical protein C4901_11495 [Acidiferrobacter sp. SPIII_3]
MSKQTNFLVIEAVSLREVCRRITHLRPGRPKARVLAARSAAVGASVDQDADADPAADILCDGLDNAPISGEVGINIKCAACLLDNGDYRPNAGVRFDG